MNNTWSHAAARTLVRPLVGTWVKPNHITSLRLATGVLACLLLARGGGTAELWSGVLWLISAFLDRADGELARFRNWASAVGAFGSILADPYRSYERGLWIDTLNDWGWKADGAPPTWYTGAPWTT